MTYLSTSSISNSTKAYVADVSIERELSVEDKSIKMLLLEILKVQKNIANQLAHITGESQYYGLEE